VLLGMSGSRVGVALLEWDDGLRRFEELELSRRREEVVRRVIDEIVLELERRLGQTFTLEELAAVYDDSAGWCRDVAQRTTEEVWAHDLSIVQDAAFARFARNATDYRSSGRMTI
jgi:hypothetical protein